MIIDCHAHAFAFPKLKHSPDSTPFMSAEQQIALMCAEAVPWRCHRSLIADALLVRSIRVEHILSVTSRQTHVLTPFAKVSGVRIHYPA